MAAFCECCYKMPAEFYSLENLHGHCVLYIALLEIILTNAPKEENVSKQFFLWQSRVGHSHPLGRSSSLEVVRVM